jgi:hypothetical protein
MTPNVGYYVEHETDEFLVSGRAHQKLRDFKRKAREVNNVDKVMHAVQNKLNNPHFQGGRGILGRIHEDDVTTLRMHHHNTHAYVDALAKRHSQLVAEDSDKKNSLPVSKDTGLAKAGTMLQALVSTTFAVVVGNEFPTCRVIKKEEEVNYGNLLADAAQPAYMTGGTRADQSAIILTRKERIELGLDVFSTVAQQTIRAIGRGLQTVYQQVSNHVILQVNRPTHWEGGMQLKTLPVDMEQKNISGGNISMDEGLYLNPMQSTVLQQTAQIVVVATGSFFMVGMFCNMVGKKLNMSQHGPQGHQGPEGHMMIDGVDYDARVVMVFVPVVAWSCEEALETANAMAQTFLMA